MKDLDNYSAEELWELLKKKTIATTQRANKEKLYLQLDALINDPAVRTFSYGSKGKLTLFLNEEESKLKDKLIEKLPKQNIDLTYKQKSKVLDDMLASALSMKVNYQSLLQKLRQESSNKTTYLFGITNIKLKLKKDFKVTDRMQIGNTKHSSLSDDNVSQSEFFKENNSYVMITIDGPDDRETARKAESQANTFINMLNVFYCDGAEPISLMTRINKNFESSVYFFFKRKSDGIWCESNIPRPGKVKPYTTVNKDKLEIVRKIYTNKAQNNKYNKYNKLELALNWLGKSMRETDYGSAFLDAMIALECIAEKQNKGMVSPSINYQISNFVAMILGKDLKERKSIIKKMKEIYGKRSLIVHGEKSSVGYDDYQELFNLIKCLIEEILYQESFKDIPDLNLWVEEQLLS